MNPAPSGINGLQSGTNRAPRSRASCVKMPFAYPKLPRFLDDRFGPRSPHVMGWTGTKMAVWSESIGFGRIRSDWRQFGRVWGGGFPGFRAEIGDFGRVCGSAEAGGEGSGDLLKVGSGVEGCGGVDETGDGMMRRLAALDGEEGAGVLFGEILFGDAEAFENGFEKEQDGRKRGEPADQGACQPAVLKPGIGLLTELAWEAGDDFDAWH